MKKILFIALLFGAFSLTGKAQSTQLKFYLFEYPSLPANTYWYHDIDLYVDGTLYDSFQIGNITDKLLDIGFTVPVGSEWSIQVKESYGIRNGMRCECPVVHSITSGKATDSDTERLQLYRAGES